MSIVFVVSYVFVGLFIVDLDLHRRRTSADGHHRYHSMLLIEIIARTIVVRCHRRQQTCRQQVLLVYFHVICQRIILDRIRHITFIVAGQIVVHRCTIRILFHTQTDDSFLQSSNTSTSVGMRRSLLSMFTMNLALIMKLIFKLYPSVYSCLLTGEFFQVEKQAADDLTVYLSSMMGASCPQIYRLKRESLVSALGCALPRVYFDIIDDHTFVLDHDCLHDN
jgi:hypothetical protein